MWGKGEEKMRVVVVNGDGQHHKHDISARCVTTGSAVNAVRHPYQTDGCGEGEQSTVQPTPNTTTTADGDMDTPYR